MRLKSGATSSKKWYLPNQSLKSTIKTSVAFSAVMVRTFRRLRKKLNKRQGPPPSTAFWSSNNIFSRRSVCTDSTVLLCGLLVAYLLAFKLINWPVRKRHEYDRTKTGIIFNVLKFTWVVMIIIQSMNREGHQRS